MESINADDLVPEDPLGYTSRTGVLLCGMGAEELVPQCRRLNISTELLPTLSEEDLKLLGASSELAARMLTELHAVSQRMNHSTLTEQKRFDQLADILTNGANHLTLIQAFITYAKIRLKKECIDSYAELHQNLRSSQAFCIALTATLDEVIDTRSALRELGTSFGVHNNRGKKIGYYFGTLGAIGLLTHVLLRKYI